MTSTAETSLASGRLSVQSTDPAPESNGDLPESGSVQPGAPRGRGEWVQDWQVKLVKDVYDLARLGVFKGHATAQAVLTYYRFNTAIFDSKPRDFKRGYVMPYCTVPAAVAKAASCTPKAVRDANIWLHEQYLIEIAAHGTVIDATTSFAPDEAARQARLAEHGPREAPVLRHGPRPKRSKIEPHAQFAQEIEPQVSIDRTSGANSEPEIEPEVRHTLQSSSYNSDEYRLESAAPTAKPPMAFLKEEEEEAAARPVGAEAGSQADEGDQALAYILNSGKDRPGLPDDGLHWYVNTQDGTYRPAVGRGRPKSGENLFEGTENDLLDTYDLGQFSHAPVMDSGASRSGEYVNRFWYGKSKDGNPYFSRVSDSRKQRKSDLGVAELTREQAMKFFELRKKDQRAWLEYKQELFSQFAGGAGSRRLADDHPEPDEERVSAGDYHSHPELMDLARKLASYSSWGAQGVQDFLEKCLAEDHSAGWVIYHLEQEIQAAA